MDERLDKLDSEHTDSEDSEEWEDRLEKLDVEHTDSEDSEERELMQL